MLDRNCKWGEFPVVNSVEAELYEFDVIHSYVILCLYPCLEAVFSVS